MNKSVLLFLTLVVSVFTLAQREGFDVDGIAYQALTDDASLNKLAVEVIQKRPNYSGKIIIPDSVTFAGRTYIVTRIGEEAFSFSTITSITLPNTIESIGKESFKGATKLKSLSLPENVKSIEDKAFHECLKLKHVRLSKELVSLGKEAFSYNPKLKSVYFFEKIELIGQNNFLACPELIKVHFSSTSPPRIQSLYFRGNMEDMEYFLNKRLVIRIPNGSLDKYGEQINLEEIKVKLE